MEKQETPQPKNNPLNRTDKELVTNIYNFVFSNPDTSRNNCIHDLTLSLGIYHKFIDEAINYLVMTGSIISSDMFDKKLRVNPKFGTTVPSMESMVYIYNNGYNCNVEQSSITKETLMFNPNELPKIVPPGFYSTGPGPVVENKEELSASIPRSIEIDPEHYGKLDSIFEILRIEFGFTPTVKQVISHLINKYPNNVTVRNGPTQWHPTVYFTPSQIFNPNMVNKVTSVANNGNNIPCNSNLANNDVTHATNLTMPLGNVNKNQFATMQMQMSKHLNNKKPI
jgi:hypothetical protein